VGLALLACAVLSFPIYRDFLVHDYALYRYAREFRQMAHPADTTLVSYKTALGLITGNGNHCNYFIGELRRYNGDKQALLSFYDTERFAGLGSGLLFIENGAFPADAWESLPHGLDQLSAWLRPPTKATDPLYLVFTLHIDLNAGWDIRCG
jgi:hypothetical protein